MKKLIKIAALTIVAAMTAAAFASCGDADTDPKDSAKSASGSASATGTTEAAVTGKTETWGNITLFVPDGMKLNGGSLLDKESKDKLSLNADTGLAYYNISVVPLEQAEKDVAATKRINEDSDPKDVEFSSGEAEWKGITYVYGGTTDCFHIYGKVDGKYVEILSGWNSVDSEQTKAVLGSLKIESGDDLTTQSSESSGLSEYADTSGTEADVEIPAVQGPDANGYCTFEGISFNMPGGFKLLDGTVNQFVPNDYPAHSDNITFTAVSTPKEQFTEENMKAAVSEVFEYDNFSYEKSMIDGAECLMVSYDTDYMGVLEMTFVNYYYFLDNKTVCITYTLVSGEFENAFKALADSVSVIG